MVDFPVHDETTIPEEAREMYEKTQARFGGFVPNLVAVMADSPGVMEAYMTLHKLLGAKTSFSADEIQVLAMTISRENGCEYCVAAHSWRARSGEMQGTVISAVREGRPLPDAKLNALSNFAAAMVRKRGWVDDSDLEAFMAAGYQRKQALDVVLAVAWKTLSNYVNHMADTPLDEVFQELAWENSRKKVA